MTDSLFKNCNDFERLNALENLFQISELINHCQTPESFFQELLKKIIELIPASLTAVAVSHPGKKEFHLAAVEGDADRQKISATVITKVLLTGQPILQNDIADDGDLRGAPSIVDQNIVSILCVPLVCKGEITGVLYLDRRTGSHPFTNLDLQFVSAAGLMASNHLEIVRDMSRLRIEESNSEKILIHDMIGKSNAIKEILRTIEKIAGTDSNILIVGETGSGKELAARAVHFNSLRKTFPFIVVNCAAIAEGIAESELFGHIKGAFTGASQNLPGKFKLADQGTLFLDEIGDLHLDLQAKLLRAIEQKEICPVGGGMEEPVDVRIIAATNKNLVDAVREGTFREDLYHRLNIIEIKMPSLQERREDIPLLIRFYIKQFCADFKKTELRISDDTINFLQKSEWPGNIRQLRNTIERAVLLVEGSELTTNDFSFICSKNQQLCVSEINSSEEFMTLRQIEYDQIKNVLSFCKGNKRKSAQILGISRSTLYEKLNEYDIKYAD